MAKQSTIGGFGTAPVQEAPKVGSLIERDAVYQWFPYIPQFTGSFVREQFNRFKVFKGVTVVEPFSGNGTTAITCKLLGLKSLGVDANPFCVFLSNTKTLWDVDLESYQTTLYGLAECLNQWEVDLSSKSSLHHYLPLKKRGKSVINIKPPEMPKLEKWMSPRILRYVLALKQEIEEVSNEDVKQLLLLSFAAILKPVSNIKLAMNTYYIPKPREDAPVFDMFLANANRVLSDLKAVHQLGQDKWGMVDIIEGDARSLPWEDDIGDFCVTSPPYPNDIDYITTTKLELFFLGFANRLEDLRPIKKKMVKNDPCYLYKDDDNRRHVRDFPEVANVIQALEKRFRDKNWGWDYPGTYAEYFGDMYLALQETYRVLKNSKHSVWVVGDSAYGGVHIPADRIIAHLAKRVGFKNVKLEYYRPRSSSMHKVKLQESLIFMQKK